MKPRVVSTAAYRREVLRLMIQEANWVASGLNLPEQLPIREDSAQGAYITGPSGYLFGHHLGRFSTTNYEYFFTAATTVSGLERRNLNAVWTQDRKDYMWPISRMDTNGALSLAPQIMAAAGVDTNTLNRDCHVSVRAMMTEGTRFVPEYWISWSSKEPKKDIAYLLVLLPGKSIRCLHVYDAKYLLRQQVAITNMVELLMPENTREAVLKEIEMSTNIVKLREYQKQLKEGGFRN